MPCILGHAMISSTTLRHAVERGLRFQSIIDPACVARLRIEGDDAIVAIAERFPLGRQYC